MLRATKHNLTLVIPQHWLDSRGFLKVPAVYALKLFYGEISLEAALESVKRKRRYGWVIKEVKDNKSVR